VAGRSGVLVAALCVIGFVPLAAPVASSAAGDAGGPCRVAIEPATPASDGDTAEELADEANGAMNVAEHAAFTTNIVATSGVAYRWTIAGTVISDYADNSATGFAVSGPPNLADRTVDFYWGRQTGPRALRVTVTDQATGQSCTATTTVTVTRSTADYRLAEHWWLTNHDKEVGDEHAGWHMRDMETGRTACPSGVHPTVNSTCYGKNFFDFHRAYLTAFDEFRAFFGYPPTGPAYNPATTIPSGPGIDHPGRATDSPTCGGTCAIPPEFTATGTTPHVPANPTGSAAGGCDVPLNPEPTKLSDWPADQNALACAVTAPWHNDVHGSIGGDMASAQTAPRDPVFWRWHMYVEEISAGRGATAPPQSSLIYPEYTYPWIAALPRVSVTYDKPITGVRAADLTVDGHPATTVTGSGAGPYVFTGYPSPGLGTVGVRLASVDTSLAESWTYDEVDPHATVPGDTLTVGQKLALSLDPTRADSGGDGIPDGFKLAHPCIQEDAYVDTDGPMLTSGATGPPIRDFRGRSLHDDYRLGINPCAN
jgi:hypothetical protein